MYLEACYMCFKAWYMYLEAWFMNFEAKNFSRCAVVQVFKGVS